MIDALVKAMATQEGEYSKTPDLPQINNNPLNLMFAGQIGGWCSRCGTTDPNKPCPNAKTHSFAKFGAVGVGWAAAYRQVSLWIQLGKSLEQLIETQAPPNENDTAAYIANVEKVLLASVPSFDRTKPLHTYMP